MDPGVSVAFISAVSAIAVALIARSNRKTQRAVEDVHAEVRTNHGKRAGEYLENFDAALTVGLTNMGQVLADALAEHTESDAANFEELRSMLLTQNEQAAERAALKKLPR